MSIGDDQAVLNVRGGAAVVVPLDLRQTTPYVLLEQEDWFEEEIRFLRRFLQPGMRAIDVGASFGLYSMAMALGVGGAGRVWAFEPTPSTADCLTASLRHNALSQVELSREAVSDRSGRIAFSSGTQSELNALGGAGATGEVDAVTLDRAAARFGWSGIDFVKLDIEGHEREAIEGGAEFLRAASPLVMFEFRGPSGHDLRALPALQALGYGLYRLVPGPLMLVPYLRDQNDFDLNLFACKADRAEQLASRGLLHEGGQLALPAPDADAWVDYSTRTPYAQDLESGWRAARRAAPGAALYLQGLAAFATSQDEARPSAERLSWLNLSSQRVAQAIRAFDSPARRLSYARLAWELGARDHAIAALKKVGVALAASTLSAPAEPFLSAAPRYDSRPAGSEISVWLQCTILEQFEKLRGFSSFFLPDSLPFIEAIVALPRHAPEMDRRRQLLRFRTGAQPTLAGVPQLLVRSEENLNPDFWSNASSLRVQR